MQTLLLPKRRAVLLNRGRFSAEKLAEGMREEAPTQKLFAPGFELALGDAEPRKDEIPIGFHAARILGREIADRAQRGHTLQHIHCLT